jgi:predicted kinase
LVTNPQVLRPAAVSSTRFGVSEPSQSHRFPAPASEVSLSVPVFRRPRPPLDGHDVAVSRNTRPTLFLTVGLPGTGKTTAARRIEVQQDALRLTKDEWVKALYGPADPPSASDVIEGRLIEIGLRALELGINVVIDFGLWSRDQRSALRQAAADRGAMVEMRYVELTPAEQRRRLDQRQLDEPHTTWHMSDEELAAWAGMFEIPTPGERDGSEPIGSPPAGFATWDHWRRHRWPPSVP